MANNENEVVAQKGAQVGDENTADVVEVTPEVTQEAVPAQVAPPRGPEATKVNVYETFVETDEVITDPSDPRAVQVPDAGRGSLDLPIHAAAAGHVEDRLSAASDESSADEAPADDTPSS